VVAIPSLANATREKAGILFDEIVVVSRLHKAMDEACGISVGHSGSDFERTAASFHMRGISKALERSPETLLRCFRELA
jgi:hypothetical protein